MFEGTTAEKDGDNIWIRGGPEGAILCEAFYQDDDDRSIEEMLEDGYILVPYQLNGENIFVEVAGTNPCSEFLFNKYETLG